MNSFSHIVSRSNISFLVGLVSAVLFVVLLPLGLDGSKHIAYADSFTAVHSTIIEGTSTTLEWEVLQADRCVIYSSSEKGYLNNATFEEGYFAYPEVRSVVVSPRETTDYTVYCRLPGAAVADTLSTRVEVLLGNIPNVTREFTFRPENASGRANGTRMNIIDNDNLTLSWNIPGAETCRVFKETPQGTGSYFNPDIELAYIGGLPGGYGSSGTFNLRPTRPRGEYGRVAYVVVCENTRATTAQESYDNHRDDYFRGYLDLYFAPPVRYLSSVPMSFPLGGKGVRLSAIIPPVPGPSGWGFTGDYEESECKLLDKTNGFTYILEGRRNQQTGDYGLTIQPFQDTTYSLECDQGGTTAFIGGGFYGFSFYSPGRVFAQDVTVIIDPPQLVIRKLVDRDENGRPNNTPNDTSDDTIVIVEAEQILGGDEVNLAWDIYSGPGGTVGPERQLDQCVIRHTVDGIVHTFSTPGVGSETFMPSRTGDYTLECRWNGNPIDPNFTDSVNVRVTRTPAITQLEATPTSSGQPGERLAIVWNSANSDECRGTHNDTEVADARQGGNERLNPGFSTKIREKREWKYFGRVLFSWFVDKHLTSGVDAIYPQETTTYTLTCTGDGQSVSQTITVPVAEPTPPPVVTFSANQTDIVAGEEVVLTWSSTDATSCTSFNFSTGEGAPTSRSLAVFPPLPAQGTHQTYQISCTGPGGTTVSDPISIRVSETREPTATISVNPPSVREGEQVTVTWSSTDATSCQSTAFNTNGATSGSLVLTPTQTTTYTIVCEGAQGRASGDVVIDVIEIPTATIDVSPPTVREGESTTISWSSTGASSCTGTNFSTGGATSGSAQVSPTQTITYSVECGGAGGSAQAGLEGGVMGNDGMVTVVARDPQAIISATPSSIRKGGSTTLLWNSTDAVSCTGTNFNTGGATSGSVSVSPNLTIRYNLACQGAPNTLEAQADQIVTVVDPQITLQGLDAESSATRRVLKGTRARILWSTQDADSCELARTVGDVRIGGTLTTGRSGDYQTNTIDEATSYELRCVSPLGDEFTETITIEPFLPVFEEF